MLLSKKKRLLIALFVLSWVAAAWVCSGIFARLDPSFKDPCPFNAINNVNYSADGVYQVNNISNVAVNVYSVASSYSLANVTQGDTIFTLNMTRDGKVIENGAPTGNYTIFWIFIENPTEGLYGLNLGNHYPIKDVTGLISPDQKNYTLTFEVQFIVWSEIFSSQAAYEASIYDENGTKVATAVYDLTAGLLLEFTGHIDGYKSLGLLTTTFGISRNRQFSFISGLVIIGIVMGAAGVWVKKSKSIPPDEGKTILMLFGVGYACVVFDLFIDIWYFELFTPIPLLISHVVIFGVLFIFTQKWALAALLEIGIVAAFGYMMGGTVVPMIAFFPGLLIAWFCWLFLQNYQEIKPDNKKESEAKAEAAETTKETTE